MDHTEQSKVRHKMFTYKTSLNWKGGKVGTLSAEGKPTITVASPPEFNGESGVWTPEDMFVASVEICHMMTFLSLATKTQIPIISYQSRANGVLEFVDNDYRFTRIVLFPSITVAKSVKEEKVYEMLREAHKHCLVANSIASIVEVNPTIMVQ
jgi:organic hydroperoxide reductase OsmC/OhrA